MDNKSFKNYIDINNNNNTKLEMLNDTDSNPLTFKKDIIDKDKNILNKYKKNEAINKSHCVKKDFNFKDICIQYVFREVLYNLLENEKACSLEAQIDFLDFCFEELKYINENDKSYENEFINVKKIIENVDFDIENKAFEIYSNFPLVKLICQSALEEYNFHKIFRLRFFFKYFNKFLQKNNMLNDIKNKNKEYDIYGQIPIQDKNSLIDYKYMEDTKQVKILYSKNELLKNIEIENLINSPEKNNSVYLADLYVNCFRKENIFNLFKDELFKSSNIINTKKDKSNNKIFICSYIFKNDSNENTKNLSLNNDAIDNHNFKQEENLSFNEKSIMSIDNIMYQQNQRKFSFFQNFNLSAIINNLDKLYLIDKNNPERNSLENRSLKEKDFIYLIRNNIFFHISNIRQKNINDEYKQDQINRKDTIFYEVSLEPIKFNDLPSEYKKTLKKLCYKVSHVFRLEYDNDYLYLFEIMQGLGLNDKVIELLEDIISKNLELEEDKNHSIEDKKFFHAQYLFYLGDAYSKANDPNNIDKAIELHEQSLLIKKEILREDHPEYVLSLNNLSSQYFNKEKYTEALKLYLECRSIEERYLTDKKNPNLGITYNNIATVYNKLTDYDKALEFYFKSLEIEEYCYGLQSNEYALTLNNIGIVYDNLEEFDKAIVFYRNAMKIIETINEEDDLELGNCYNNLAVALENNSEYNEAVVYYEKSLKFLLKHCDKDHPDVLTVMDNIEVLHEKLLK